MLDICAVVVTHNPALAELLRLLALLDAQVGHVVVIDNASSNDMAHWLPAAGGQIELFRLNENVGIAAAQNLGINRARAWGAAYVLLSDQDSLPATDMVHQLQLAARTLQASGVKLAAVGPNFHDPRNNNPVPFVKVAGLRLTRIYGNVCDRPELVDYVIASGCLIPVETLDVVGLMREEMFIDYVDIEWGLRCASQGYQSFGVFPARMSHRLGESMITFRGRNYPFHSPLRHYYMVRNAFWLYRQKYIPWNWKCINAAKLMLTVLIFFLKGQPWGRHFGMSLRGAVHGMTSRMGRY